MRSIVTPLWTAGGLDDITYVCKSSRPSAKRKASRLKSVKNVSYRRLSDLLCGSRVHVVPFSHSILSRLTLPRRPRSQSITRTSPRLSTSNRLRLPPSFTASSDRHAMRRFHALGGRHSNTMCLPNHDPVSSLAARAAHINCCFCRIYRPFCHLVYRPQRRCRPHSALLLLSFKLAANQNGRCSFHKLFFSIIPTFRNAVC